MKLLVQRHRMASCILTFRDSHWEILCAEGFAVRGREDRQAGWMYRELGEVRWIGKKLGSCEDRSRLAVALPSGSLPHGDQMRQ